MRKRRVVVRFRAGPAWTSGPPEEQADWDAHAAFVDDLVDRGTFVMGGPFSDHSGSMVLLEGVTGDEARALLEADPFMRNGVFVLESVQGWTVYVDELSSRAPVSGGD
ncbi:MAG: YciI family protein [Actinomycetota bacterium]|nr:YciI family protein [Actinomycetota bacterium]